MVNLPTIQSHFDQLSKATTNKNDEAFNQGKKTPQLSILTADVE